MIAGLLDHLWQSTLFAGAAGLLTLALRRNGAAVRFWLWFAASVKFLLPFAALAWLGAALSRLLPAPLVVPPRLLAIRPEALRLSAPARQLALPPRETSHLLLAGLAIWVLGFAVLLGMRLLRGARLYGVLATARALDLNAPAPVKVSASLLEPGLVGIFRPVVLLPAGLLNRLSAAECDTILAHEFSHYRRHDNLIAAIHMLVESLLWFYPPVWLVGARLLAERELACDESVLAAGHDREVYATGILKVCKFYVHSPLACVAGASGADLRQRLSRIMTGVPARRLGSAKRLMLAGAATLALGLPLTAGFVTSPLMTLKLSSAVHRKVAAVRAQVETVLARNVGAVTGRIAAAPVTPVAVHRLPRRRVFALSPPALQMVPQSLPARPPALNPAPAPVIVAAASVRPATMRATTTLKQTLLALWPNGTGDPDGITCRVPQVLPSSRLPGPVVCKVNRIWALLRANDEDISPDGTYVISNNPRALFAMTSGCYTGSAQASGLSSAWIISACH